MKNKKKNEKMGTEKKGKGAPSILHGTPCCTVHDPSKERGLNDLIKKVGSGRKKDSQG